MESLISPLKLFFRLFSRRSSDHNRNIEGGAIKGDSNVVTYDQSFNPSITVNQPQEGKVAQVRIDAADAIWRTVLKIKSIPNNATSIMDIAYPDITDEQLRSNPNYVAAKNTLTIESHATYSSIKVEAEPYKPYASECLWALFEAYVILSARPSIILMIEGESKARVWWSDAWISKVLSGPFIPQQLKPFIPPPATPLAYTLGVIEEAIKREIQNVVLDHS